MHLLVISVACSSEYNGAVTIMTTTMSMTVTTFIVIAQLEISRVTFT